jgi:hypothetical protein
VTLVEYGDFDCPFCRQAYTVVRELIDHFSDDLRFVFRHNPRGELHPHARIAAQAAEAAAHQGRFWKMHDRLFEATKGLEERSVIGCAEAVGLDRERFLGALHSASVAARVREDEVGGLHSGVIGSPTFFVQGVHYRDKPDFESLASAIRAALARPTRPAAPDWEPHEAPTNGDKREARPLLRRYDRPGHMDPHYQATLLRKSGHARTPDEAHAFLSRNRSTEQLAETLGEEFVDSATHGQDAEDELFNQLVPEEEGGPFVESNGKIEFANDAEPPNIPGATREPFPKT